MLGKEEPTRDKLSLRKVLQGAVLILISNLVYIGNNYIVAWTELRAPEIALVRGGLQVILFGVIAYRGGREAGGNAGGSGHESSRLLLCSLIFVYGVSVSTMSFACLAAIQFMPIGDLIVISFASPVFSVFLDRIILKRLLTFLSVGLCILIVLGDVLVVQPPFIFGEDSSLNGTDKYLIKSVEEDVAEERRGELYYLGVGLCLFAALAGAVANVVGAQCNKMSVSTSHLMLVSGFSSIILSFISSFVIENRLLTGILGFMGLVTDPGSLSQKAAIMLPISAAITMVAYWTITLAVSITRHPTLISMLRSTEILISLVTESLWYSQLPGTLSLVGSLLVAACVLSMAAHDQIVAAVRKKGEGFRGKKEEADGIV